MAYTDKAYFLTKVKEAELNNLLKDSAGAVQMAYLDGAIKTADDLIDSYLRPITEVPLVDVPEMIRQCSFMIALYFLHERIDYADTPERIRDNYKLSLDYLKELSEGNISLNMESEKKRSKIFYDTGREIFNDKVN